MSGLKDILNDGKGMIPEDKLLAYLEGKLSLEEQHEVERWLAEEGMESDALEGLKTMPAQETRDTVHKLNYNLRKQLTDKRRKRKEPIKDSPWSWVAVVLILLLCIVGYVVFRYALKQ